MIVGNGGFGPRHRPDNRKCTLTKDRSAFIDSADEVIRFATCTNYESGMVGTKTTGLVTRDLFDPNSHKLWSPEGNLFIPEEVVSQVQHLYIMISLVYRTINRRKTPINPYQLSAANAHEFYKLTSNVSLYHNRYPKLRDAKITLCHTRDMSKYYRGLGEPHQGPSVGFMFLYYMKYYTSMAILDDVYLAGFQWEFDRRYHNVPGEKKFVDKMVSMGLIKGVL